jgi:hypothetical protein
MNKMIYIRGAICPINLITGAGMSDAPAPFIRIFIIASPALNLSPLFHSK